MIYGNTISKKSNGFRNLVFEGGGVKGIAYGGALKVLDSMAILKGIERVAGTSGCPAGQQCTEDVGVGGRRTRHSQLFRAQPGWPKQPDGDAYSG